METSPRSNVTSLLIAWSNGDSSALDQLLPLVYQEMRRIARYYMAQERAGHTLQATALVNEAYLRLVDVNRVQWQNRAHFFAVAGQMMRRVLVEFARSRGRLKRGNDPQRIPLDEAMKVSQEKDSDLVALDEALSALATVDTRLSRVVELRFFGGLTVDETAEALRVSPETVTREWNIAKVWLLRELST